MAAAENKEDVSPDTSTPKPETDATATEDTGADSIASADDTVTASDQTDTIASDADTGTDTIDAASGDTQGIEADADEAKTGEPEETISDINEAEALSAADPEPALTDNDASTTSETTDDDATSDAATAIPPAGADPEGTGPADYEPSTAPVPVVHEKVIERKGGFFPMLLGGVVAAGLGFTLSQYLGGDLFGANDEFANETRAALTAQTDSLDALNGRIDGLESSIPEIDLTSVESAIATLSARSEELGVQIGDLSGQLTALQDSANSLGDRVGELEKAPMEAAVSPAAIEAYEQEIARLRGEVTATLSDVETQRQEISAMAETAVAAERAAEDRAMRAELRTALATLTADLDAGRPFATALEPLAASDMVTVPEVLSANAADGIATQAELIADYPDSARAALAAARDTEDAEGGNPLAGFLAEQLGARSVTPRDGDSADAVLSRAEAAVKGGDLETALNEISTLSEPAQAAVADWVTRAETRAAALAATETLSDELDTE
ncbi:Mitochondrial inner membrane protein [Roseivivax sp. THAF40]|uniref:hypothetical protein n=1 Tax=unclassified Roseivivax TaxID=2639302 RepID=UPI0012695A64|nr:MULTISPECIES: hypothetical protein [unclassified Roseivivax]QFS84711.1 Mitochondrial inner membrane protein [Roseivivax sp. THAF197b]QFT48538.1 Mitochondrial inner membrane protein [Roseivivax sp. THAF40]